MKGVDFLIFCWIFLCVLFYQVPSPAQVNIDQKIERTELNLMIDSIAKSVEQYYISEEMGKKMGDYVLKRHSDGVYQGVTYEELGKQLTKDFVEVSGDVHMSAFFREIHESPKESILSRRQDGYGSKSNYGYTEVKITEDNIGYLKIAHFTKWKFFNEAKEAATEAIGIVRNTDALIIDVRDNPGGFEDIVAYVMSHFFEKESFHLQKYFCRYEDRGRSISTSVLPIKRNGDIPIYILINKNTGSAGESLAYMMKHLKRATLIGETSVGAGNGSTYFRINNKFIIQVATWETINAVTNKSWEKSGVVPHITIKSEDAYKKAYELALVNGKHFAARKEKRYKDLLEKLDSLLSTDSQNDIDELTIKTLISCQIEGLYNEGDLNSMGYKYLREQNHPQKAEAILRANVILYPTSPNVYDSYGEALVANGKIEKAIENYEKAATLAEKMNDENLPLYVEALERVKKIRASKK